MADNPIIGSVVPCPPNLESRKLTFGPQLFFVTVVGQAIGGADIDFLVQLPFPCRKIQIASILAPQNSVFLHLVALNKNYGGGNAIVPTGRENWIPMTVQPVASAAPWFLTTLTFRETIKSFFLDMGHENGTANVITFLCTPEDDGVQVYGGPWT
jgi:hypothetical protein